VFSFVLQPTKERAVAAFQPNLYQTALALLIKAREDAGLSRAELAERFDQPEAFVSSYEAGDRLLDPAEFIALCRAIGVDPHTLLHRAEKASGGPAEEDQPRG
jgi:ribosome-binding protein aMBF1 (putative translation factor)